MLLLALLLHQVTAPNQNNRYLKLTCMEGQLRLAYTILFGDLPAEAERRRMDADGDGRLSDAEAAAYGQALARAVEARLSLEVDGRSVPVRFTSPEVGLGSERGVHPVPFSVDLVVLIPAPGRQHTVFLDDRFTPPREGETDFVLEEAPGARITASFRGRAGEGLHGLKWTWPGPRASDLEDRSVTFRYQTPNAPAARGARTWLLVPALAAALALSILSGLLLWRRATSTARTDSRS
ncbi:MAG TPA: hypothetical protein VKN99_05675 [Polyangia bacterium]|nr:hypothetical protein [Polyangia bacterium]